MRLRLAILPTLIVALSTVPIAAFQGTAVQRAPNAKTGDTSKSKKVVAPITLTTYRWTTYQNGWAEVSYSLKNNTTKRLKDVRHRVVFYARNGEPIHFEEPWDTNFEIPPRLAITRSITLMDGGLNIYQATAKISVEVLSFQEMPESSKP